MAMQQSGKSAGDADASRPASGSGPNPALSDEQADEFAASFTPAWDTGGDDAGPPANATLVDAPAVGNAQAAAVVQAALVQSAPAFHAKQTLIGTAPQANAPAGANGGHDMRAAASSAEAIDPENILDSRTAPQPAVQAAEPARAPAAAPQTSLKGTHIMQTSPAQIEGRKAQSRPPPAPAKNAAARNAAVSADPFAASARSRARSSARSGQAAQSDDLDDFVPKKSSKTLYFVVGGLAVAAGLGLFLKFALGDDGTKPAPVDHATGPAVTTAEIPPPPPKVDTPPPPAATTAAAAKVDPTPPPATLPAPPIARQPDPPAHVAAPPPRQEPRPRVSAPPVAAAPPPPVTPKTPPKPPNGSIVRDNPF